MGSNLEKIEILVKLIEQEKFNIEVFKSYGRYFIEFETSGLQVREMKKFFEYLPSSSIITSHNDCLCIDTTISVT